MKGFAFKQEEKEYKQDGKGTYKYVNDIDIDGPGSAVSVWRSTLVRYTR